MKSQTDPDEVDDLATLEVLDEVRKSAVHFSHCRDVIITEITMYLNNKLKTLHFLKF